MDQKVVGSGMEAHVCDLGRLRQKDCKLEFNLSKILFPKTTKRKEIGLERWFSRVG